MGAATVVAGDLQKGVSVSASTAAATAVTQQWRLQGMVGGGMLHFCSCAPPLVRILRSRQEAHAGALACGRAGFPPCMPAWPNTPSQLLLFFALAHVWWPCSLVCYVIQPCCAAIVGGAADAVLCCSTALPGSGVEGGTNQHVGGPLHVLPS
jgi:hypothetical protein